jgi:hypothetical protein
VLELEGDRSRGVIRTIGGSELALDNMNSKSEGSKREFKSQKSHSARTSEEELVGGEGIMKTTNVKAVYDAKSLEETMASPKTDRNSESVFRYQII